MSERIRVTFDTDLRRRRLAVLFRLLLALPALVAFAFWSLLSAGAVVVAWLATVALGRTPRVLHRFLCNYIRNSAQLGAWLSLASGRYPRLGLRRPHPVWVDAPRLRQGRLRALFRGLFAVPSLVLAAVLTTALAANAVAAWFVSLVRGSTTEGLRELGAFCVRYHAETLAYLVLVTARAPKLEPPPTTPPPEVDDA